jgi:hypothetical protein
LTDGNTSTEVTKQAIPGARGIRRLFGSAWFALLLALLAMAITSFCLTTGFATDDYFFLASFKGFPGLPEYEQDPLKTFVFADGNPERNAALMDRGISPWWSVREGKLAFWRPLASRSHWLDYRLFGDNPWPMHFENMAWYAVLCAGLCLLYRRLAIPLWVAGLAALLYTIDSDNGMNVGWISSRNTLMSACFVVATVLAHHRWRGEKSVAAGLLAPVALFIGLMCGEAAMGAMAYLLAYALFMDKARWPLRFASLIPCGTVFSVWFVAYRVMGYGTVGSAWYVDPGHAPLAFLNRLLAHLPALMTNQFIGEPTTVARTLGGVSAITQILGMVALVLIFLALLPLLRRSPLARFAGLGALLSMLPVCTVVPQPRLMLIPGIGGMILVALYLHGVFSNTAWVRGGPGRRRFFSMLLCLLMCAVAVMWILLHKQISTYDMAILTLIAGVGGPTILVLVFFVRFAGADWVPRSARVRVPMILLACAWVVLHGIIPCLMMPIMTRAVGSFWAKTEPALADIPSSALDVNKTVTILQAPNDFVSWYFHIMRSATGQPIPAHTRSLSTGEKGVTVSRPDANTLLLQTKRGLIRSKLTSVYRGAGYPMREGEEVAMSGMTVTVKAVGSDGWPTEAEFRYDVPLEDEGLRWYSAARLPYRPGSRLLVTRFIPVTPPAIGETVAIDVLIERSPEYQALKVLFPERAN